MGSSLRLMPQQFWGVMASATHRLNLCMPDEAVCAAPLSLRVPGLCVVFKPVAWIAKAEDVCESGAPAWTLWEDASLSTRLDKTGTGLLLMGIDSWGLLSAGWQLHAYMVDRCYVVVSVAAGFSCLLGE